MLRRTTALAAAVTAAASVAAAKDPTYIGSVHVVRGDAGDDRARGHVFLDADRDSMFDEGERGIEGVLVSNGREVVSTDADGAYALPAYDDMNLFITRPAGHMTPVDENQVRSSPTSTSWKALRRSASEESPPRGRCSRRSTSR